MSASSQRLLGDGLFCPPSGLVGVLSVTKERDSQLILGHQCAPQSSLLFQVPTRGPHHRSLGHPNLPVATHAGCNRVGLGWTWVFSTCVCGTSGTRIDLGPAPAPQRVAFSWATASGLLSALLFTGSERAAPALRGVWGGFNVPGNSHCPRASRHNSLLNYGHKFLQRDGSSGLWGVDASVAEGSSHFF